MCSAVQCSPVRQSFAELDQRVRDSGFAPPPPPQDCSDQQGKAWQGEFQNPASEDGRWMFFGCSCLFFGCVAPPRGWHVFETLRLAEASSAGPVANLLRCSQPRLPRLSHLAAGIAQPNGQPSKVPGACLESHALLDWWPLTRRFTYDSSTKVFALLHPQSSPYR